MPPIATRYEAHRARDQDAGRDRQPGVFPNVAIDAVSEVAHLCSRVTLLRNRPPGIVDRVVHAVAQCLDLRIVGIGEIGQQFFRAVDQLVQFLRFFQNSSFANAVYVA